MGENLTYGGLLQLLLEMQNDAPHMLQEDVKIYNKGADEFNTIVDYSVASELDAIEEGTPFLITNS